MTDMLVLSQELLMLSMSIGVFTLGFVLILAILVGHRLAGRHYDKHKIAWATEDVAQNYRDSLSRIAELNQRNVQLQAHIELLERTIEDKNAIIKAALVQQGQVSGILSGGIK